MKPEARGIGEFEVESIGDEVLVLDTAQWKYHLLNQPAFRIWQAADGTNDLEEIALRVFGDSSAQSLSMTHAGLARLEEEGFFHTTPAFSRRSAMRIGVSLVAASAAAPIVLSSPVATAAQGLTQPTPIGYRDIGANCKPYSVIEPCVPGACCCHDKSNPALGVCRPEGSCGDYSCDR